MRHQLICCTYYHTISFQLIFGSFILLKCFILCLYIRCFTSLEFIVFHIFGTILSKSQVMLIPISIETRTLFALSLVVFTSIENFTIFLLLNFELPCANCSAASLYPCITNIEAFKIKVD